MIKIGIIGHGADKFTKVAKTQALVVIKNILISYKNIILISGHSPVGGIDIWAEEIAKELNIPLDLKIPKQYKWDAEYGYKQRNLDIARDSDEIHVILVDRYPFDYQGQVFERCYHCNTDTHVKSGACWTGNRAKELNKRVIVHVINNW